MRELLIASLELLVYGLGTGVLAIAGLFAEWSSMSYFTAGNLKFTIWLVVIGAIALYASFSLGTEKLLPLLRKA
ncbi:MAG: hypothetical protein ACI8UR_002401 [Natronomonas sp.]|jgi:hypothetical protein|uniref:hypothetical protein n=1 Tax=Natronomonas sp. TaxID=2184060 RepID=UPI003988AAC1